MVHKSLLETQQLSRIGALQIQWLEPTFNVAMKHFVLVAVIETLEKLLHVALNLLHAELLAYIRQPCEVVICGSGR